MSGKDKALDWNELERIARVWGSERYSAVVLPGPLVTCGEVSPAVLRLLQERRELREARTMVIGALKGALASTDADIRDALIKAAIDYATGDPEVLAEGAVWADPEPEGKEQVIPGVGP